jgi:exopolyphosphatase / guanosine-5'-triphosphate,3'-diphosphate pyrophosphatase
MHMHPHLRRDHYASSHGHAAKNYAALDLGTNNCRLLIARPTATGFRVIDAFSRIVRLGEGLALTNRLCDEAISRSIEALKICREKIELRGVNHVRLVATEACRIAQNGSFFLERVSREAGIDLEIVTRETEARLAAAGCAALADPQASSVILFDIGGGSTEVVWLKQANPANETINTRVKAWVSLPVGVVTLADRYGGIDVTRECFERMVSEVSNHLAGFTQQASSAGDCPNFHILGTSGTVTTIAGVFLELQRYQRKEVDGIWMGNSDVERVMQQLLNMSFDERAANPCIGAERADLVLAGCAIFEAIRRAFPSNRVRIADRGLREGILMEMMQADGVWHTQPNWK